MRENLVEVNIFLAVETPSQLALPCTSWYIIFLLQPANSLVMQGTLARWQFNQIPCLILYERQSLIIHSKLPLSLDFHL